MVEAMREAGGPIRRVCVYCGSATGHDPRFARAARAFGTILATNGIELVFGGGGHGLMGALATSVLDGGGRVTGIIPRTLEQYGLPARDRYEAVMVPDLHARKRMMFEMADGFVALPGGFGTLEELVEQLTWVNLSHHAKPVVLADIDGFWRPLVALLDHMREHGFIWLREAAAYLVAETTEDILPTLREAVGERR